MSASGGPAAYEIRLRDPRRGRPRQPVGYLVRRPTGPRGGTQTVISGPLADQAAPHGLLAKIGDLGLYLISVRRLSLTNQVLAKAIRYKSDPRPAKPTARQFPASGESRYQRPRWGLTAERPPATEATAVASAGVTDSADADIRSASPSRRATWMIRWTG